MDRIPGWRSSEGVEAKDIGGKSSEGIGEVKAAAG